MTPDQMADAVVDLCKQRKWPMDIATRGLYMHLEVSELVEAMRGKHPGSTRAATTKEAADVLITLMAAVKSRGISFDAVMDAVQDKIIKLRAAPPYRGELRDGS